MSGAQQVTFMNQRSFGPPPGQQAFTTAGTFTWVAPTGVTKVSVVAVGGGNTRSDGGIAGSLGYKNNISVTPGAGYTVVVGAGVAGTFSCCGGDSSFINACTVKGSGGTFSGGQSFVGDGGGLGGIRGGGAGGYSGNGGNGGSAYSSGAAGSGGGGGGAGSGIVCCFGAFGGGGGVGILGQGSNGAGGVSSGGGGGGGGSGGTAGTTVGALPRPTAIPGGVYGGGGGSWGNSVGPGGGGAVRIIWPGCARSFPSTRTGNE